MERYNVSANDVVVVGAWPHRPLRRPGGQGQGALVILAGLTHDMPRMEMARDVLGIDPDCGPGQGGPD